MSGKIGVLTFHKCINYGSFWQARCLVEGLRGRGFDAEILDHHCDCVSWAEARTAFQPMLPRRSARADFHSYSVKARKFADAIDKLPLSKRFSLDEPEAVSGYDAILVGSDEVWNLSHPWYGGKSIFYGVGLRAPRLVSYAASFGSYSCHWGIHDYWAEQLKRFDSLSVRDENSYWLVRGSTGREPQTVLDPCLQFDSVALTAAPVAEEPHAIVYGHSFPEWMAVQARRWSSTNEVKLLSVGYRNEFADEQRIDAGPIEFASLIAGARAVITNYFHGCVFSLMNRKPFAAASTDYRQHKLRGLVELLGAPHRLIEEQTSHSELNRLLDTPPLPNVLDRLSDYRGRSQAYLDATLS